MELKKWIILLGLALLLVGCSALPAASPASPTGVEGAASSGPTGLNRVEVSDGVVLITPGQSAPVGLPAGGGANLAGFVTATPTATVDPASVAMPEGIPLYPGANVLQALTGENPLGVDIKLVEFSTTDGMDQVIQFYTEKAEAAGWTLTAAENEPDYEGKITQMWNKDGKTLMLFTWQPVDGVMKVQVSWM